MALRLTYLGHATAIIETEAGMRILMDPWIDANPGCPYKVATLPHIDLVVASHAAWDHIGDVLGVLERFPETPLICARDVRAWAKRKGVPVERIKVSVWGFRRREGDLTIQVVETHHNSFIDDGEATYSDICNGYIFSDDSGASIYHMGDTAIFSDLKLIGELYDPKVALVPVGSAPGAHAEMSPTEAAMAASWVTRGTCIPIHYVPGEQEHLISAWMQELKGRSPAIRVHVAQPGETLQIEGG